MRGGSVLGEWSKSSADHQSLRQVGLEFGRTGEARRAWLAASVWSIRIGWFLRIPRKRLSCRDTPHRHASLNVVAKGGSSAIIDVGAAGEQFGAVGDYHWPCRPQPHSPSILPEQHGLVDLRHGGRLRQVGPASRHGLDAVLEILPWRWQLDLVDCTRDMLKRHRTERTDAQGPPKNSGGPSWLVVQNDGFQPQDFAGCKQRAYGQDSEPR